MEIETRRLTAGDAQILDHVAEGVFDEPIRSERVIRYLAEPNHHMIVALVDGQVVGQVAAVIHRHPDKPTELYVDEVGVVPAMHRRGIGRRLFDEMLALGRELGCEEAWLGTEPDNVAARALYERRAGPGELFLMFEFDILGEASRSVTVLPQLLRIRFTAAHAPFAPRSDLMFVNKLAVQLVRRRWIVSAMADAQRRQKRRARNGGAGRAGVRWTRERSTRRTCPAGT